MGKILKKSANGLVKVGIFAGVLGLINSVNEKEEKRFIHLQDLDAEDSKEVMEFDKSIDEYVKERL